MVGWLLHPSVPKGVVVVTLARRAEAARRSVARRFGVGPAPRGRLFVLRRAVDRSSLGLLRVSLGLVFIWFGALKATNVTPVAELVANTLPFLPGDQIVPALGLFEFILGVALIIGRWTGLVVLLMIGHLAGTFLVLVIQPEVAFLGGNPLVLTMTGEFVVKNLILISAGLVLATPRLDHTSGPAGDRHGAGDPSDDGDSVSGPTAGGPGGRAGSS
ncbi:DoxX family membrane protein [Plantactinospora solaniradicis]|uniref:DoxX family membrane protein n=1 Tax=Plantactinospora solaniradicis TaxID=1723736 RepID=A0ABW1K3M1_9ACTN